MSGGLDLAGELRRAFDHGFAVPPAPLDAGGEDLLSLQLAGDTYAVRVAELAGLACDRRIAPVPSPLPELLGIIAQRGALLPVYELRRLLDYPAGDEPPRWLLLVGQAPGLALAFDRFHRHIRVAREALAHAPPGATRRVHVRQAVRLADELLPVLELASVVEDIERRVRACAPVKER